jgi:Mesyanzhinovviridae bifunctional DNA primase/polymerase
METMPNHTVQQLQNQASTQHEQSGSTSASSANGHTGISATLRAQIVQNINATYAVITGTANMGKILVEEVNPVTELPDITIVTKDQLKNRLANRYVGSNTGRRNTFNIWWQSSQRREVKGIVFDPTGEISDEYYNLWRGFAVEPVPGDWSLFQQHIREAIARGDEEIYHE